ILADQEKVILAGQSGESRVRRAYNASAPNRECGRVTAQRADKAGILPVRRAREQERGRGRD
ncbi:MAG TPA: hypothetical protein VM166_05380, partial [Gemmatimonadaceae bacterium]|nr:hypothetical protein [Gemmatimonadaceae bacterium]